MSIKKIVNRKFRFYLRSLFSIRKHISSSYLIKSGPRKIKNNIFGNLMQTKAYGNGILEIKLIKHSWLRKKEKK